MSEQNGTTIILSVMWFGWAISCKWMGLFNIMTAVILAIVTIGVLGGS